MENLDGNDSEQVLAGRPTSHTSGTQQEFNSNRSYHGHLKVPAADNGFGRPKSTGKSPRLLTRCDKSHLRGRGFSSSKDGDDTAAMWRRAIKADSVSRSPRRSTSLHLPVSHIEQEEQSESGQPPEAPQPSVDGRSSGSGSQDHSPTCHELPTQEDEDVFRWSLVRSNTILNEWARQLEVQESETRVKARTQASTAKHMMKASKMPPASWSKFPSHNREERNEAAGEVDSIKPRDFAVKEVSAAGDITWTTDKRDTAEPSHKSIVRSFSDRFTHSVKSRLSKMVSGRSSTPSKDKSTLGKRRSSVQTSGNLEYPELELLPTAGGYSELQALEREINEMKGLPDPRMQASSEKVGATTNRLSLTEKMTGVLQHDGISDAEPSKLSDTVNIFEGQARLMVVCSPATPAPQIAYADLLQGKDSSGSSGERYGTPFTHLSSCPGEYSRAVTPHNDLQPSPTPQSSSSADSSASVIRRVSSTFPKTASNLAQLVPGAWNQQDSMRRRSAPVPIAPSLV